MSSRIAQEAHTGFAASSAYDTYRPSYPAEAVSQLLSALKVAGVAGATIADLAAGTGKFTELLAARPEQYKIIAIEPHDGMREQLEKKKLQGLIVLNGTAENMSEIADGSLDALVVAQVSLPLHTPLCWPKIWIGIPLVRPISSITYSSAHHPDSALTMGGR
jgi:hypothetical protein